MPGYSAEPHLSADSHVRAWACNTLVIDQNNVPYCRSGPWQQGNRSTCDNFNSTVPFGQGTGTYGSIAGWNVSKVKTMANMFRGRPCSTDIWAIGKCPE